MLSVEQIVNRVERKVDKEKNHFPAYGFMASAALFMTASKDVQLITDEVNEAIVDLLEERGFEGVVFDIPERSGQAVGDQADYGGDMVFVAARNGEPTNALPRRWGMPSGGRVPVAFTNGFSGPLMQDFLEHP